MKKNRAGFTLVELLVVIVVISVLLALILPAISRVRQSVNVAKVQTEISQLESAIIQFRGTYGIEPPSRFVIYITEAGWNSDLPSKVIARRMWPHFDFKMDGGAGTKYPSTWTADQKMNSGECLLFFLGGVIENGKQPNGFSKNPSLPFSPGGNRSAPFLEFDQTRIRDTDNNGLFEYHDILQSPGRPYLYFSSYEGRGYKPAELCMGMTDFYRTASAPFKPHSFQIISPGIDGEYGDGGFYDPENTTMSLAQGRPATGTNQNGRAEYDNITNFSSGMLVR